MGLKLINASNGSGEAVRAALTGIRAPGSTTFNVDSVVNWPAFFVATAGTKLADGTLDPSTVLVFSGHLTGSQIILDTLAPGYTDPGSSVADIVVLKPTTMWADNIQDFLDVTFDDDGTVSSAGATQVATALGGKQIRLKPRLSVTASTATLAPNIDNFNYYRLSAQAAALSISNPTGTPNDGDGLLLELQDNGTTRAITWGADYAVDSIYGLTLPTTTVAGKTHFITFVYNLALTKWVAVL